MGKVNLLKQSIVDTFEEKKVSAVFVALTVVMTQDGIVASHASLSKTEASP